MNFNMPKIPLPDMQQITNEASTIFSRAKQYTEEKLGSAEKTDYDETFEILNKNFEKTRKWTERLKSQTETALQPNPNKRFEDFVYHKLDRVPPDHPSYLEQLGITMVDAGRDLGSSTKYGDALIQCGKTEVKLGQSEQMFVHKTIQQMLTPFNNFLEEDVKNLQKRLKNLETKRLDLDACKSRVRKSRSSENRPEFEAELQQLLLEFNRQVEAAKLALENIDNIQENYTQNLLKFVDAQTEYYEACHQHMKELRHQLKYQSSSFFGQPGSKSVDGQNITGSNRGSTLLFRKKARVLYDYEAVDLTELSLISDEIIAVEEHKQLGPGWVMGYRNEYHGKVPINYITFID